MSSQETKKGDSYQKVKSGTPPIPLINPILTGKWQTSVPDTGARTPIGASGNFIFFHPCSSAMLINFWLQHLKMRQIAHSQIGQLSFEPKACLKLLKTQESSMKVKVFKKSLPACQRLSNILAKLSSWPAMAAVRRSEHLRTCALGQSYNFSCLCKAWHNKNVHFDILFP